MSPKAASEVLKWWADWSRRLKTPVGQSAESARAEPSWQAARTLITAHSVLRAAKPRPLLNWQAASRAIALYTTMRGAEGARLSGLYRQSKLEFSPLSDPLDVRFPLHRQLSYSREEVYSDWLQWALLQIADPELVGAVLKSQLLAHARGPITIDREIRVEQGYADQAGRLDLAIRDENSVLAAIEVKTRPHSDADLDKHVGYAASLPRGVELIFLAIDQPESEVGGFRFLSWADVCLGLRRIAARRLSPECILGTALILAFVGAVEQNLLGFVSPEGAGPTPARMLRMVEHFERARKEVEV